jgi:Zn-dependent M28 family amino/carboxypeptidase
MQSSETSAENVRNHLYHLAAEIGERNVFHPDALHRAEEYIKQNWDSQGYQVVTQEYTVEDVRSANLEVNKIGNNKPDEIILIGAHYDSVIGSPGANDNGSGVAALLEISRQLSSIELQRTVRFVAFVNEEPPFFVTGRQGSRVYSKAARQRGDDIRLMIALETMGYFSDEPRSQSYPPLFRYFYPDRADFIAFVSNFRSRKAMLRLARAFRASTDFPLQHVATFSMIPGVAWSDHLSFWLHGYRALMVTDTAFYRYPYYHTHQDTPDKLNYLKLAKLINGLAKAIVLLANMDSRL